MADLGPDGMASPLDPKVKLYGVKADNCTIFRSAIQPVLFQLRARTFSADPAERATQAEPEL